MGFTTGFLGGVTLTYSVLYLTIYLHKANRNVQQTLLKQSHILLNSVVEPLPPAPEPPAYELRKAGLLEEVKDRWNSEIEKLVRNVQETDWNEKREQAEQRIAAAWGNLRETEKAQELEQRFKENVATIDKSEEKTQAVKENVKDNVREGLSRANEKAQELQQRFKENVATTDKSEDKPRAVRENVKDNIREGLNQATGQERQSLKENVREGLGQVTRQKRLLEQ